jgi:hypothetical protein
VIQKAEQISAFPTKAFFVDMLVRECFREAKTGASTVIAMVFQRVSVETSMDFGCALGSR